MNSVFPLIFVKIQSKENQDWLSLFKFMHKAIHQIKKYGKYTLVSEMKQSAQEGQLEKLLILLSFFLEDLESTSFKYAGLNCLHLASKNGHLNIVKLLMTEFHFDMETLTREEFNAAELALQNGHMNIVTFLTSQGLQINFQNANNLSLTLKNGHVEIVKQRLMDKSIDTKSMDAETLNTILKNTDNYELVQLFFNLWIDHHNTDKAYEEALDKAMLNGQCALAEIIMKKRKDINIQAASFSELLSVLASSNRVGFLNLLLSRYPNQINLSGLLAIAASAGQKEMVQFLIQNKTQINKYVEKNINQEPLFKPFTQSSKFELPNLVSIFNHNISIKFEQPINKKVTSLILAIEEGHIEIAKYLITHGAEVDLPDSNGKTPLAYAVSVKESYVIVKFLLDNNASINIADSAGCTALHYAASSNNIQVINLLLSKEAKISANNNGETPLFSLIEEIRKQCNHSDFIANDYLPALELLFDPNSMDGEGNTVLHHLCQGNDSLFPLVKFVVDHGNNANALNKQGLAPFHYAVCHRQENILEFLLNKGANTNLTDKFGNTILHMTCRYHNISQVINALEGKISFNTPNHEGETPLFTAAKCSTLETVKQLVKKSANLYYVNATGDNILHFAAKKEKNSETIDWLLENKFNINEKNHFGITPLLYAAQYSDLETLKYLIERGANKYEKSSRGDIILHFVAMNETFENDKVVKFLLTDEKLDINTQNREGNTPFHLVAGKSNVFLQKVKNAFLEKGVKINIKNNTNTTSFDLMKFSSFEKTENIMNIIYKCPDIDLLNLYGIVSDLTIVPAYITIINTAIQCQNFFDEAISLIENPPQTLYPSSSPIQSDPEKALAKLVQQRLELSKNVDEKYFTKYLMQLITKFQSTNNFKILNFLGKYTKHITNLPNDDFPSHYDKMEP